VLGLVARTTKNAAKIEFGDFQTPLGLAVDICALLKREGIEPDVVVEPTCGLGTFLVAAARTFPGARMRGLDINAKHLEAARQALQSAGAADRSDLRVQDFFVCDWDAELRSVTGSLLLLGNPPWVTNAVVGGLNGSNLPVKENFQGFRRIEARTGKSNFDISEWMLIRLLNALQGRFEDAPVADLNLELVRTRSAASLRRVSRWQSEVRDGVESVPARFVEGRLPSETSHVKPLNGPLTRSLSPSEGERVSAGREREPFTGRKTTLALLCKTATARKALKYAWENHGRVATASLYRIDAKQHFDASVDACLLVAEIGSDGAMEAAVFDSLQAAQPSNSIGLVERDTVRAFCSSGGAHAPSRVPVGAPPTEAAARAMESTETLEDCGEAPQSARGARALPGRIRREFDLVADIRTYRRWKHLDGECPYRWRSGLKHDCAPVMELRPNLDGTFTNKLKERVRLEPEYLYPLLKCTDLSKGNTQPGRFVLVTQKRVGEDTRAIARRAPQTWDYLQAHAEHFQARKSSIYKNVPFALFGVGTYSFAPWKVAVSGLHRRPRFVLAGPRENRPVLFDDTCYFLSFDEENAARTVANILNTPLCLAFMETLLFPENKRPVTVELLQRLNLRAIARETGLDAPTGW